MRKRKCRCPEERRRLEESWDEPVEKEDIMANIISDETIDYIGILAKLALNEEEKEQAKQDMGRMLDYIDKLNELDTEGVEPMSHVFPVNNVFREDVVVDVEETGITKESLMENAPQKKDNCFLVPKTV